MNPAQKRAHDRLMLSLPCRTVRPMAEAREAAPVPVPSKPDEDRPIVVERTYKNIRVAAATMRITTDTLREWVRVGWARYL